MNDSAEPASLSSDRHREDQISKVNYEAGNDVSISIMTTTTDDEHQTAQDEFTRNATATPATATDDQPPEQENPDYHQSMYKAATEGDWAAAQTLLREDPSLGWEEITQKGDRAIHLAILGKHTEFVRKLTEKVEPKHLESYDGHGYTACCYAVMEGDHELVRILMKANPNVANAGNWHGTTPFAHAISYGRVEILSYLLSVTKINYVVNEEQWFDVLLVAIASKRFDLALMMLEKNGNLALQKGKKDNRTALHVLAQLGISSGDDVNRQADLLAKELWEKLQILGRIKVLEMMKNPPILNDAAKVGNLDLVNMIINDYPDLLSHIDEHGHSVFHIVVMNRNKNMLELFKSARLVRNFNNVLLDKDYNNLLHFAAKSIRPKGLEIVSEQDVQMKEAFSWFQAVEAVTPSYKEMKNKEGDTPKELFWKEHANLLETSQAYMKSTAESCMLISTIVLSLVFAAAFAPPGGLDEEKGIPTFLKKKGFAFFIIFEVLALSTSTLSIIGFWSIISSNYEQHHFLRLPHFLRLSMCALLLSVLFVISAFLSAFFLVFVQERKPLVLSFMLPLYSVIVGGIFYQLSKVSWKIYKIIKGARGKLKRVQ